MIALAKPDNLIAFPAVVPQGKSNEWYTKPCYLNAARKVMGDIDLDPASCELANKTVKAKRYYTKKEDGLKQAWHGRVWCNPPFRRREDGYGSSIELFTRKLVDEYKAGNVTQAILLCTLRTETPWFQLLWEYAICFANHNVRFIRDYDTPGMPGRYTAGHMHGTLFVYFGKNEHKFAEIFSEFGAVIPANVAIRKQTVQPLSLWEVQHA